MPHTWSPVRKGCGGEGNARRKLQRVPEQHCVEDTIRGEVDVHGFAPALIRRAAHGKVPSFHRLRQRSPHALCQRRTCISYPRTTRADVGQYAKQCKSIISSAMIGILQAHTCSKCRRPPIAVDGTHVNAADLCCSGLHSLH